MMRLALGTVQFGQRYGIANVSGQVDVETAAEILESALSAGLDTLDTAIGYGDSEACLGAAGVSGWRVVTKLPPCPTNTIDVTKWVTEQVDGSLSRLRISAIDTLLLHKPTDLLGPAGAKIIAAMQSLKRRGLIRKAGISIYAPAELDATCPIWLPDVVQAPCNVFDRRLIRSGWLDRLLRVGVQVHIRSLFLQGLLLMPATQHPAWFTRWSELLTRWATWCAECRVTPLEASLAYAQSIPGVERLIVGVDSIAQWHEIVAAAARSAPVPPEDFCSDDPELIEPSRWQLK
jgi:hypothetical protein